MIATVDEYRSSRRYEISFIAVTFKKACSGPPFGSAAPSEASLTGGSGTSPSCACFAALVARSASVRWLCLSGRRHRRRMRLIFWADLGCPKRGDLIRGSWRQPTSCWAGWSSGGRQLRRSRRQATRVLFRCCLRFLCVGGRPHRSSAGFTTSRLAALADNGGCGRASVWLGGAENPCGAAFCILAVFSLDGTLSSLAVSGAPLGDP